MKLDKIVLNGFKSFADKTEFTFDQKITGIVGPNGCGKSNVVDAMKWVLGNQSPKALRSGQMTDVIFSGSSSRKPSGLAEVSLSFSDVRGLGLEQDGLDITRRLYRSGESEYLINGKVCRLRDIRELFMDTGVGVSAYSIIEQGQIDQLLQASKVDRRVIFEEAAGISKFKAHKREALRKLERTEQNLLRLADIVGEVQKQLRSVKLQAGKARSFLGYTERLKELRVTFSLAEYDKVVTQTREKSAALAEQQERFGSVAAEVARYDASLSQMRATLTESEGQINRWDSALIAARSKIEQQLERIGTLKVRMEELSGRKKLASEQIRTLVAQSRQLSADMADSQTQLQDNERLLISKQEALHGLEDRMHEIQTELSRIDADLEDEKSGIIDLVRRTAQLHNEIQSLNHYRDNLNGQKDRLNGRATAVQQQLADLLMEKAQYQARRSDIQAVLDDLQRNLDAKRGEMAALDSRQAEASEGIAHQRAHFSGLSSERKVLGDMEAKREGLSETLKEILRTRTESQGQRYGYIEGIVADLLSAAPDQAGIVEAALEGCTDMLVVNRTSAFLEDSDLQARLTHRVGVLCLDRLEPFVDQTDLSSEAGVLRRVVECVRFESVYAALAWNLLGRTLLVDSVETALRLSWRLGPAYRFVTPKSEVVESDGSVRVGPLRQAAGLISRKSRIQQLDGEMAIVQMQIRELEAQQQKNTLENEHLARLCKDFRTSIYEANTEKVDAESRLRLVEQNIKRLMDEQPVVTGEIQMLEVEISKSVQREHDSKQKLDELEQINAQRSARIQELQAHQERQRTLQQDQAAVLTELKVELGQFTEQQKAIRQRLAGLQSQLQHARMAAEAARTEATGCDEQTLQAERNILSAESRTSELYAEMEKAQHISRQLHRQVEQLNERQKETEQILRQRRVEQTEIEQQLHQVQLELGQLQVRDEDLRQRVRDELQMDLVEAYQNYRQQQINWDQVRDEIASLKEKIERLGNVNVDAIQQQDELEKRSEFLTQQVEDLNQSKKQLEQLIDRINKESREKFIVTFEQVRANFQTLFRKLFGGGKADVLLENPEDVLESGIEIVARPPGKETRSISLLSGGEKTMTAISLLFAVFRSKPSPFCFLDEVDAALDEANNERFNLIVQEFKTDSQFVIVTHSKRTMAIADMLYGITMQMQGVSKRISVQFEHQDSSEAAA
ncbi:MAG: chromosome segregation protein SMC [Phycisphaerae bacterium]|nr:chromosome segregation protein SMC [Phycisphaerae bacterium]